MLSFLKQKYFSSSDIRMHLLKKNIYKTILIKAGNILINLLLVPLTINYINPEQYGVWLTLSSVISWLTVFDVGIGNGLRNKFAEAIAIENYNLAKIYVSTTYSVLILLSIVILLIFIFINPYISWSKFLNNYSINDSELNKIALFIVMFFCFQFVLQIILTIFTANQQPARSALVTFIGNFLALLSILLLNFLNKSELLFLTVALGLSPIISIIISSIYAYQRDYKIFRPDFKFVKFKHTKSLIGLGAKFFILQIGAIILFQTNNIIISQLFGSEEVTNYNIVFKYFGIPLMLFNIFVTPFWSAFTDAWVKKDLLWIHRTLNKLKRIFLGAALLVLIMLGISNLVYKIWIGEILYIPFTLSFMMAISVTLQMWQSIFLSFLNGSSKVNLQIYLIIFCSFLNFPLANYLGKHLGPSGVILSSIFIYFLISIVSTFQVYKILNLEEFKIKVL